MSRYLVGKLVQMMSLSSVVKTLDFPDLFTLWKTVIGLDATPTLYYISGPRMSYLLSWLHFPRKTNLETQYLQYQWCPRILWDREWDFETTSLKSICHIIKGLLGQPDAHRIQSFPRGDAWDLSCLLSCASSGVLLEDCALFGSASRNQTGHNIANLPFSFAATIN